VLFRQKKSIVLSQKQKNVRQQYLFIQWALEVLRQSGRPRRLVQSRCLVNMWRYMLEWKKHRMDRRKTAQRQHRVIVKRSHVAGHFQPKSDSHCPLTDLE
jgi:hypothetical protein